MIKQGLHVFFYVVLLLPFWACGEGQSVEEDIEETPTTPAQPETFQDFIQRFNRDEAFHVGRVVFPLIVESLDGDLNPTKSQIKSSSYRFRQIALERTPNYDVTQKIEKQQAIVKYRGEENGISVSYHFEQREGQWFLVRIEDLST
ncbi:MAG: hypothetical protein AAFO96_13480 [Bacteroidota bacterium]